MDLQLPAAAASPPTTTAEEVAAQQERQTPDPLVNLIGAAVVGDQRAWRTLHQRYAPLIRSVAARYRLGGVDADDLSQLVWLKLVEHLKHLREPRALPGWIQTTARNEALKILAMKQRTQPADPATDFRFDAMEHVDLDEDLERRERQSAVRAGLASLRPQHRELLLLLASDVEFSYEEIGQRLGIPTGSIGPTRARCLAKLRATKDVRSLLAEVA